MTKDDRELGHTADCPHFEDRFPWKCDCRDKAQAAPETVCRACKGHGGVSEDMGDGAYVGAECPACHGHGFSEDVEDAVWSAIMEAQGPDSNARHYARAALLTVTQALAATRLEALQAQPVGEEGVVWAREVTARYFENDPLDKGRREIAQHTREGRYDDQDAVQIALHTLAALTASTPVVTPKWDVCRNCVDGSKAGQTCTVCEGRGHVPFVPTPVSPPVVEREAMPSHLSVIPVRGHPEKHAVFDAIMGDAIAVCPDEIAAQRVFDALTKTDAILARTPVEGVGERSPELVEVIREWLASTDHPVSDWECQFAEAIRSMMRASGWIEPNALSTPVAQGDEVREALAAWRSVQQAHRVGDPHGYEYHAWRLNAALATLTKGARDAG